ncbi:hypothetical protein AQUCO_00800021v1 [Aquilegia coerulea]|uniref:F-box domain-containing protein n=1 Tax=Aquilegia coerulea TaxID=218851 RepID=A0A2G5EH08_AQUCA|nr:hypothetical protein AQUCO_00800021v1 [Aquilegia coerulea]
MTDFIADYHLISQSHRKFDYVLPPTKEPRVLPPTLLTEFVQSFFFSNLIELMMKSSKLEQTRAIRRKRVMVNRLDSPLKTPLKKKNFSYLESLPQDILIKILCSVDHGDLKQLFQVSESIRQTTMIVKRDHFAFSTPSKRLQALRSFSKFEMESLIEDEAPNAPKQQRSKYRNGVDRNKLADISVALFGSPDKQWRTNRILQF